MFTKQNGQLTSNFTPLFSINNNRSAPLPNHSLTVTGTQTIGTTDPISAFNRPTSPSVIAGSNSMIKIHRNLFSGTSIEGFKGSSTLNATGYSINNYPNGLEITSYKPAITSTNPSSPASSVALAIGTTSILNAIETVTFFDEDTGRTTTQIDTYFPSVAPTGFFVSDDGRNVGVGQYIDTTTAIGVSATAPGFAIKAKGNVGVTGTVGVIGNIRTSGIVRADSDFTTGTDTPGWTNVVLTLSDVAYGSGTTVYKNITALTGEKSLSYKIIGKTVHVHFYINAANSPDFDTFSFYIKLPSVISPKSPHSRFGGTGRYKNVGGFPQTGMGIPGSRLGTSGTIIFLENQTEVGGTAPAGFYLSIDSITYNNFDTQGPNPIQLRGSITYELP